MSKKRKRETPLISVDVPHPEEKIREVIGAELVEKWYNEHLDFDTIANDVKITARDPSTGRITLKEEYTATNWKEIQKFLDDIRHRLVESVRDELLEYVRMHLEVVRIEEGITPEDIEAVTVPERARVSRKVDMVESWLRDIMGLEGRARPIISVSNIARSRLTRGTDPARKLLVREARELMKMWRSE